MQLAKGYRNLRWSGSAISARHSAQIEASPVTLVWFSPVWLARIVKSWVAEIALDSAAYGTHSLRRTKASLIYRRTKNLRAVQLLLGHSKLDSTVRYLGIEIDDALEMSEQVDV